MQFKQLSKSILPSGFSVNECPLKRPLATVGLPRISVPANAGESAVRKLRAMWVIHS